MTRTGLDRREFVTASAALCVTLPGCAGLTFVPNRIDGDRIAFAASAFAAHACVGIDHPRLAAPIAVCKLPSGELSAVAAICTHKSCELRPAGDKLECPCHGSAFALTGEVLSKPATRDLRRFNVWREGDTVYVGG